MAASQSVRTKGHILAIRVSKRPGAPNGSTEVMCVCVFFFLYAGVETSQEISSPLLMDGGNSS